MVALHTRSRSTFSLVMFVDNLFLNDLFTGGRP
jgi:hypothetical protein